MIHSKDYYIDKAEGLFNDGYACSQAVALAFAEDYHVDERTVKLISSSFGGGMGRLREKCGAITGSFMIIGLAFGSEHPENVEAKKYAYSLVREFNQRAEEIEGSTICRELLKKRAEQAATQHHSASCRQIVGTMAGLLFDVITEGENHSSDTNSLS